MKFLLGLILGIALVLGVLFSLPKEKFPQEQQMQPIVKQKQAGQPVFKGPLDITEALDKYIELNPQDSNAYLQKADYLAKNGRLKEALDFYDKALYYDGRNTQAYMNRGAVNYMLGNYESARRDLSAAINLDASKGETFFNRALANINLGFYGKAKEDFKQAAILFNKVADKKSFKQANQGYQAASGLLAQVKRNKSEGKKIKGQTEKAKQNDLKTSSNEALNKKYTSQLMTSLSNSSGMLEKFKEARQKAGSEAGVMPDFEAYAASMREQAGQKFKQETAKKTFLDYKDEAYKKQAAGDTKGALEAINKAIELNPKEADLYRQRAQLNMAAKEPQAAIADYTKALSLNSKDAGSLYNRALAKDMIGDKKGARQDMQQALGLYDEQGDKKGAQQAREMQNLWEGKQVSSPRQDKDFINGANAFNSGKYQEALNSWDNLIKKYPNEAAAYYNRAITNVRLQDTAAAEKDYRKAIELNPNMTEALDGLSGILVEKGKTDEAMQYIDKSLKINPENPNTYRTRGFANMKDNPSQAQKDFAQALAYNPEDAVSYLYRGILNAGNNNMQAGISDLQNAQKYAEKQNNQQVVQAAKAALEQLKQIQQQGN